MADHNRQASAGAVSVVQPGAQQPATDLNDVVVLLVHPGAAWRTCARLALLPLSDRCRPRDVADLAHDLSHVHSTSLRLRLRLLAAAHRLAGRLTVPSCHAQARGAIFTHELLALLMLLLAPPQPLRACQLRPWTAYCPWLNCWQAEL